MKKTKVALIFGGKSAEHEVSVWSAKNVFEAIDKTKFEAVLIGISKQGSWFKFESNEFPDFKSLTDKNIPSRAQPVVLLCQNNQPLFYELETKNKINIDIAFPVMHGTYGEDGCIQGLFRMYNLPFVGCGVFASAAGMDKEFMKKLFLQAGIPTPKFMVINDKGSFTFQQLTEKLGAPFFIKPANMGSSVGVHKIKNESDFKTLLADAFKYDHKVLAEEFVDAREIECSVLGLCLEAKASLPGEVLPTHEFYSYEAKYLDEKGAAIQIPAKLTDQQTKEFQTLAVKTFQTIGCDGLTRVDFFMRKSDQKIFVNEVNTIPGFTKISMYPKMWEATGVNYSQLITRLLEVGLKKAQLDSSLVTDFNL